MSEATNPLVGMNLEALNKLRDDGLAYNRGLIREQKMVGAHLAKVSEAIRSKEAQGNPETIIVTDHALVRWLERIEGMDLEPIRAEIRRVISAHPIDPVADQNICIDTVTKAVVVTRRDRTAVTVLHQDLTIPEVGQLSVMKQLVDE